MDIGSLPSDLHEKWICTGQTSVPILALNDTLLPSSLSADRLWRRIDKLLDESKCLRAVLVDVLLVRVGVVAVAAIRVRRVAVRLDDGRVGGRALEAAGAGGELIGC